MSKLPRYDGEQPAADSRWAVYAAALVIVLAGWLAYRNSLEGQYVFDDVSAIVRNPTIRQWWPPGEALTPRLDSTVSGRPVLNYTLAINYALGGLDPRGYHAANLGIHLLAGLTLFGLVRRTLRRPGWREKFAGAATPVGMTVALLWMLHPLQTEAVSYLSQRAESLAGLFYLLTLYTLARAGDSGRPRWWLGISAGACLLGMGTKEMMVTAPVMAWLYDRTFLAGSFRAAWARRKGYYAALAATWIWLGYLVAGTNGRAETVGFGLGLAWWQYALTQVFAMAHYLTLALWPSPLVFDYGQKIVTGGVELWVSAVVVTTLGAGTLWALVRRPALGFLGAWFFVILAPSSSVVPVLSQTMAEHRMYLPLAAVIMLAVGAACQWAGARSLAVFWVLALGLGWATQERNADYRTRLALAVDNVEKTPESPRAHVELGDAWLELGRTPAAMEAYEEALRMQPDLFTGHNGLGMALVRAGRLPESITEFHAALALKADEADTHYNLAQAYLLSGNATGAIGEFQAALKLNRDDADVHYYLGNALAQAGRMPEALAQYAEVRRLEPNFAAAEYGIGTILAMKGDAKDAIPHLVAALRLQPNYAKAWENLGVLLVQTGQVPQAVMAFKEAAHWAPGDANIQHDLEAAEALSKGADKAGGAK
jgi:tetratricopeptide (TPR) repeat protein